MVSYLSFKTSEKNGNTVLILVVVDDGLVRNHYYRRYWGSVVLILIVVDNGLVHYCRLRKCKRQTGVLILIVVDNGIVQQLIDPISNTDQS